jgi:hypothetical protein
MNQVEAQLRPDLDQQNPPQPLDPLDTLCTSCHGDRSNKLKCSDKWRDHLIEGRASEAVWEAVTVQLLDPDQPAADGTICGW